jgi:lipoprotein NlpD
MDFIQQYEHFNNIPLSFDWSSGYYEIRKGDTLFNISVKIGINVEEIIKLNNLKEPYTLYPSQKLKIK